MGRLISMYACLGMLLAALLAPNALAVAEGSDVTVNINTATVEQLAAALDGVGAAKAQAIVEYREQYGDFVSVDELVEVRGIGEKVLDANRDRILLKR